MGSLCKKCGSKGHSTRNCKSEKIQLLESSSKQVFDKEIFNEWFKIDIQRGTIEWKKSAPGCTPGESVGWITQHGDIRIRFRNVNYSAHQIIWFMATGKIPCRLYHRNDDLADNRITNLTDRRVESKIVGIQVEDCPEAQMKYEAKEQAKLIQPRRDPMVWAMFGEGVAA